MSLHYSHSHTTHSPQTSHFPPVYSFSDLQDIWNLQKEILDKYKSTQVPFVILDQDNTGVVSSKDFAYRLIARGFPCNTALYLKFFAFLDTNCDGFINFDDWTAGFKNIGSRLVEARCQARGQLQALRSITPTHYRHVSSIDGYSTTPAKPTQISLDYSSNKNWAMPKGLENNTLYPMTTMNRDNTNASCRNLRAYDTNLVERDQMQRINLRVNEQGSRHSKGHSFDATSSGITQNKEKALNINAPDDTRKDFAERINRRVDNIIKGIENRKALLSENSRPQLEKKRPESIETSTNLSQNLLSSLKSEVSSGSQTQKAEEIHQSIKKFSAETIGALRSKIGQETNQVAGASGGRSSDTYAPSVTSIAAIEEENPDQFIKFAQISTFLDKNSGRKEDRLAGLENSLQAKITKSNVPALEVHKSGAKDSLYASEGSTRGLDTKDSTKSLHTNGSLLSKKFPSPQETKRSLGSQSSASVTEGNPSRLGQIKKAFNAERRKNSKSIAIPAYSSSEKDLETPSWREFPKNFPVSNSEEGDILEMIEKLLEQQGDRADVLKSLKKDDLVRFPHLKNLVKSLDDHEVVDKCFGTGERGRQHTRGVKRRSRTKSMIELRVKGDLVLEIEREVQRRRAITPENSVCHSPRVVREKIDRIANAEKMIESLREFSKKKMRIKSKSVAIGAELAKEILEGKGNKELQESGSNNMYSRVQEKLRGERKYGEAKKTCKEIIETFTGAKKGPKIIGEGALNNIGYSIQANEVAKRNLCGRERGFKRKEDHQETDNEKRSRLKRVIDELSQDAASMEKSLSKSKIEHKRQQSTSNCEQLWKVISRNDTISSEKQSLPEKRRVKSFIRGSISSSSQSMLGNHEEFNPDQYRVQAQLQERLNQTKMLNRYSKMANDLGTFSVQIDKPERQASISPLNGTRSSKNSSISVSNLLQTELTGRGKSFLQNQYTRLDAVNNEMMNQTTRSQKKIGLSKF